MKDVKKSFKDRKFKMGGYQTLVMVIVIVLVVVLNLIVNKMNISVDLSSDKKYTLTEDTKKLAQGIKDKVKLYYMCQEGNQQSVIEKVLEQYNGLGNIEVVDKDPVVYPNFSKQFTDEEIQDNDVIVVNETKDKKRLVSATKMLVQDMDYMSGGYTNTLDAEGQITAALQIVTSDTTNKLYYTSGHGEGEIGSSFQEILDKSNIEAEEIATASAKSIPEDCRILMINGPVYDFTEEEYSLLSEYLKNGGKAMIYINALPEKEMTNFYKLLADYGVNVAEGFVLDAEGAISEKNPTAFVGSAKEHEITEELTESSPVVVQGTKGLTVQSDVRSTLTVDPLLTTTDSAFSKTNANATTLEKEDKDINGPFAVAAAITDVYAENTQGQGKATKIVLFASSNFNADAYISSNQFGNRSVVLQSATWLTGGETTTLAIPTRSLNMETVMIQEGDIVFFTVALVVVLPLILLAAGFVIWFRRRKN